MGASQPLVANMVLYDSAHDMTLYYLDYVMDYIQCKIVRFHHFRANHQALSKNYKNIQ